MRIKPLMPEEVKPELREYLDFDTQKQAANSNLEVRIRCPKCNTWRWRGVGSLRSELHSWTGLCVDCVGVLYRKPLTKSEVPESLWPYIDFENQHSKQTTAGKNLCIEITCPECGSRRWRRVSLVRRDFRDERSGLCRSCTSKAQRGKAHPGWLGGKYTDSNGYVRARITCWPKDKWPILEPMAERKGNLMVAEHRAVVALALGRPLKSEEHVHHINGDRADNRLENLRLVDHHKQPVCPMLGKLPNLADCAKCGLEE